MMTKKYDESNIQRFAGLAGIRAKPTVYVGETDHNGLWTILREPADNAVDQALAGRNDSVHLVFDKGDKYWIIDQGEGIPVGKKVFEDERGRKEKLSTFYVVTGLTHGGGNFSGDNVSRGTHGIGIKATNALSDDFVVWTFRDKQWWVIKYKKGKLVSDVKKDKAPKLPHGLKVNKGTIVCFTPDRSMFTKGSSIKFSDVKAWCQLTSFLVPKLQVKYTLEDGKTKTFISKNGPADYITLLKEELKCDTIGKTFAFSSREIDVAIGFSDAESVNVRAFTNGLSNIEGGVHLDSMFSALVESLKPYKGKLEYKAVDLQDGLIGLINAKIAAPKFNNQRKDKLVDDRIKEPTKEQLVSAFTEFWKKNKGLAKEWVKRASELRKLTANLLKDKKLVKNVNAAKKTLPAKLKDVVGKAPISERELFLVEGDSAGGTSAHARFKDFQATFALKGKPLNVMDTTKDKVNANAEIAGIFAGIGLDLNAKNPVDKIRFGRIIFLADPDVDGGHINCLLLTLFWKYLPDLFKQGRIFLVSSPEYMAMHKDKAVFGYTVKEVRKACGKDNIHVSHVKGWGEINADDMRPLVFDKKSRKLWRIMPPRDKKGVVSFQALMGKNSAFRKQLIGVI